MNSLEPAAPSRPAFGLRVLRLFALLGLGIGAAFLADLLVLALLPLPRDFIYNFMVWGLPSVKGSLLPLLGLVIFTLGVCGYAGWRLLARSPRTWVQSGLLVMAVLVADLLVLAFVRPGITEPLTDLFITGKATILGLVVAIVCLIPMAVFAGVSRLRSWGWIGGGYLAVSLVLAYLAVDDQAVRHPVTFAQLSPTFPGAEASYDVLMRYGKKHPLGKTFRQPQRVFSDGPFCDATKPAEWPVWLEKHRAAIEADWVELAPVRAWITELNTHERIGDLMPAEIDAEIITFGPFRAYTHNVTEMAGLQAMAGRGDEAMATLLPLLEVSRKLEPSSRSLVRTMVARVMQNNGLATARFVLDTAAVSPAMRTRLASALNLGTGGEAGVRYLLAIENSFMAEAMLRQNLGNFMPHDRARPQLLRRTMDLASPFVFNRRHTINLHAQLTAAVQESAAKRDLVGVKRIQTDFYVERGSPTFKNFMGNYFVGAMVPSYGKVIETYWKVEDSRTTLLLQLEKPAGDGTAQTPAPTASPISNSATSASASKALKG